MQNPNCDGGVCLRHNGEVRVLPSGGDSNLILCQACFFHEMNFRRERNKELGAAYQFKLPKWTELKIYQ